MKKNWFLLSLLFSICLFSCIDEEVNEDWSTNGMRPVYSNADWRVISDSEPQNIRELGKIYYKDGFIFVNERGQGIHIIDNNDPLTPTPVRFINIIGNYDISIKGNYLYADNVSDMVVLDISNINDIKMVNRVEDIYPATQQQFPQNYNGFFECVDPSKGTVIYWTNDILKNPKCQI